MIDIIKLYTYIAREKEKSRAEAIEEAKLEIATYSKIDDKKTKEIMKLLDSLK